MGVTKTNEHIQIKIRLPNPCQEPPAPSKAPNEYLKDMDVLCTFKIKIESQNLDYGCTKDQRPYQNQDHNAKPQSGTYSVLQSPNSGHKGHGCSVNLYNQDQEQDVKPQSGTSSIPKRGLKGYGCSLHLQNQVREPKVGPLLCQTPVRNLQHPPKPQMRT